LLALFDEDVKLGIDGPEELTASIITLESKALEDLF
jgi:hypothetical protein